MMRYNLYFCCKPDNDLYVALSQSTNVLFPRYSSPLKAIAAATDGTGILILADDYPSIQINLDTEVYAKAKEKNLRLYIEFPSFVPGLALGNPTPTHWERTVVASDVFGKRLERERILEIHGCYFLPTKINHAHLVLARVAGFDKAVYGIPQENFPILFEFSSGKYATALIATTKLSQFITARYAPYDAWSEVWKMILLWLGDKNAAMKLTWTASVRPAFKISAPVSKKQEIESMRRGARWFINANLFLKPNQALTPIKQTNPWVDADLGRFGIMEGLASAINHAGKQSMHICSRNDCNGEVMGALSLVARVEKDPCIAKIASNLGDYVYYHSIMAQGERANPGFASFGLVGWNDACGGYRALRGENTVLQQQAEYAIMPSGWKAFYGDDNARSMLGTMLSAAALTTGRWNQSLLRCLLANLRTTGKLGFRGNRLDQDNIEQQGWQFFFNQETVNYAPHFEAYLWACFLWAYRQTGFGLFLDRAKNAIRMTMQNYPYQWRWSNGLQQERARMLLPLAWLVRIEKTPEHLLWLSRVAGDLLAFQDKSGAIREEIGSIGLGIYAPPVTNEAYGTKEAPLIQNNGDSVADLLYTMNFAFLGLHEAFGATQDLLYQRGADLIAKFLCRIQVRSEVHPELDGGWFRAFDFKRWDYWASNADMDWGAWCIESGWTQSWITSVLALRGMKTDLWDLTKDIDLKKHMPELRPLMIPDNILHTQSI